MNDEAKQLTVAELIEQLQAIEDKELLVCMEGCDCYQDAALVTMREGVVFIENTLNPEARGIKTKMIWFGDSMPKP